MSRFKIFGNFLSAGLDLTKKKVDDVAQASSSLVKRTAKSAGVGTLETAKIATKASPNVRETTKISIKETAKKSTNTLLKAGTYGAVGVGAVSLLNYGNQTLTRTTNRDLAREDVVLDQNQQALDQAAQGLGLDQARYDLNKNLLDSYTGLGGSPMDFADAFSPSTTGSNDTETSGGSIFSNPFVLGGVAVAGFFGYRYLKKSKKKAGN